MKNEKQIMDNFLFRQRWLDEEAERRVKFITFITFIYFTFKMYKVDYYFQFKCFCLLKPDL